MNKTLITSTVSSTVDLGTGSYSNDLLIAFNGDVETSTPLPGAPIRAVYGSLSVGTVSLTNAGAIVATSPNKSPGGIGVDLLSPGNIANFGCISGTSYGVLMLDGGSLYNAGIISSTNTAVDVINSTSLYNDGLISASTIGVVENTSYFQNSGTVISGSIGVYVGSQSTLQNFGNIVGELAVYLAPGATLFDSGIIASTGSLAVYATAQATIALLPGAKISGLVEDTANSGEIILGGSSTGSIDVSSFSGFDNIVFDSGAKWAVSGTVSDFSQGQTIIGMNAGDSIFIENFAATTKSYVNGTGAILSNGTSAITINIQGNFTSDEIVIVGTQNGTVITAPCFAKGTLIETPYGSKPVEHLNIGDYVKCFDATFKKIKWIGHRAYKGQMIASNNKVLPICIRRSTFSPDIPRRDLFLSPDHSLFLSGKLIAADRLINGRTIFQVEQVEEISYYHIELDQHEIIFAEGCPVESFLDVNCRDRFQNCESYYRLYPKESGRIQSSALIRMECEDELAAIQLSISQRAKSFFLSDTNEMCQGFVDEIRSNLIRGWAQDIHHPNFCLPLHILADGTPVGMVVANQFRDDLKKAKLGSGYHGFSYQVPKEFAGSRLSVLYKCANGEAIRLRPSV